VLQGNRFSHECNLVRLFGSSLTLSRVHDLRKEAGDGRTHVPVHFAQEMPVVGMHVFSDSATLALIDRAPALRDALPDVALS